MKLPTGIVKAERRDPKVTILYGPPKVGKTTMLSKLPNCIIVDLEEGSDLLDAVKIKIRSLEEFREFGKAVKEAGKPYKYLAIDTVDALENWCEAAGTAMYKQTPIGKAFDKGSVLELPNGAGYYWLRQAFNVYFDAACTLADHVLFIGHVREKSIEKKGKELTAKDLDLTGKIKSIACAKADAIGYVYRGAEGELRVNFIPQDEVNCGSRCEHLRGKDIEFEWKNIFID
jgi:hypothetical protein